MTKWTLTENAPVPVSGPKPTHFLDEIELKGFDPEETEEEHAVRLEQISKKVKADMKAGRYRGGQLKPNIESRDEESPKLLFIDSLPESFSATSMVELMRSMMTKTPRHYHELYGGTLSGRMSREEKSIEAYRGHTKGGLAGRRATPMIFDEAHSLFPGLDRIRDIYSDHGAFTRMHTQDPELEPVNPKKPYWRQPIPLAQSEKPVSSPSEEMRAKRRAKRKKHK